MDIDFRMKFFHQFVKIDAGKHQKCHAQKPTSQNKISQKQSSKNFYERGIERKKNHVSQGVVGPEIITVINDIQIPICIPAVMHINQTRIFWHRKTFRRDPRISRVRIQIETIESHESKKIHDKKPY